MFYSLPLVLTLKTPHDVYVRIYEVVQTIGSVNNSRTSTVSLSASSSRHSTSYGTNFRINHCTYDKMTCTKECSLKDA